LSALAELLVASSILAAAFRLSWDVRTVSNFVQYLISTETHGFR